jgi:hypothetical protein
VCSRCIFLFVYYKTTTISKVNQGELDVKMKWKNLWKVQLENLNKNQTLKTIDLIQM